MVERTHREATSLNSVTRAGDCEQAKSLVDHRSSDQKFARNGVPVFAGSLVERSHKEIEISNDDGAQMQASNTESSAEEEEEEDDEEPPWMMSRFDKICLQAGWLFEVLLVFCVCFLTHRYWPYANKANATHDPEEACCGLSLMLYRILWGQTCISSWVNALIVFVAVLNFLMFTTQTEANFDPDTTTPFMPGVPLNAWITTTNERVQKFSVAFFALILVLRSMAARAHPNYRQFGANAWWRWLLGSVYAHIDIIALLPTLFDMFFTKDYFMNLIWISLARTISWMERQESSGAAVRQFKSVFIEEGALLASMFIFGTVLWIFASGLYFLANEHNPETVWNAAVSKETGAPWQRFESIPAAMFFVLLNLCKENPLAECHVSFCSRLCVVLVCVIGTPVFALPTGVVGALLQNRTQEELEGDEDENDANGQGANDSGSSLAAIGARALAISREFWFHLLTSLLSFGSVFAYFYYTAGPTRLLFGITISITEQEMAWIDGTVGAVFAVEWLLRCVISPCFGRCCYVISVDGIIDLVSWLPGVIHFVLFQSGRMDYGSSACRWLLAANVLRVLKPERYCRALHDMVDILRMHSGILQATLFITALLWILFSTLLYYTEHNSSDSDLRENYGSASRALWAEIINLHGEWVWADYSVWGKGICAIIALFSQGLFMIPICIFSDGFQAKMEDSNNPDGGSDFELQPWQSDRRPPPAHVRRPLYDLLYGHLHLPKARKVAETLKAMAASSTIGARSSQAASSNVGPSGSGSSHGIARVSGSFVLDAIPELTWRYKCFRFLSIFLVSSVSLGTILLTDHNFKDGGDCRKHQWCAAAHWGWYCLDAVATVFFSVELVMRIMAIGPNYCWSFVGICDIVSLATFWVTLTPFRRKAFHPSYDSDIIADDMAVPLRLLRLFCLDSYLHPLHLLSRIVWVQRHALRRSFYALVSFWFIFTTLMYLFEWNPQALAAADAKIAKSIANGDDLPDLIMAQRYRDILTGLQYGLVHLTGDYPVTDYTFESCFVHIFAILFGMCTVAAFTGIFVSGFTHFLKTERIVERRHEADKRLGQVMFAVLAFQRQVRRRRNRRLAMQQAQTAPEDAAGGLWSYQLIKERDTARKVMSMCHVALIVNIFATLIESIPEVNQNLDALNILNIVELLTGYIFVLEYMIHLSTSSRISQEILKPARLLDLWCLLPVFVRLWLMGKGMSFYSIEAPFRQVLEIAVVSRVLRVLDIPFIRKTGQKAFRAVMAALSSLVQPAVLAVIIWITTASVFMWLENLYNGRDKENMRAMPETLYWTSIYILGEWANVDFSPGAGSRMCIFYCLFGVAVFAVPVGLMMEAVEATLTSIADERKSMEAMLVKQRALREDPDRIGESQQSIA